MFPTLVSSLGLLWTFWEWVSRWECFVFPFKWIHIQIGSHIIWRSSHWEVGWIFHPLNVRRSWDCLHQPCWLIGVWKWPSFQSWHHSCKNLHAKKEIHVTETWFGEKFWPPAPARPSSNHPPAMSMSCVPLPAQWLDFLGQCAVRQVHLSWSVFHTCPTCNWDKWVVVSEASVGWS